MIHRKNRIRLVVTLIVLAIAAVWIFAGVAPAFGHGGKSHGGKGFSSLQAVQKATELYERLIGMQKLPEQWETRLISIHVSTRQSKGKNEFIVQFKRAEGDPDSVYFFFDQKGEYSGSNFTGR